MFKNHFAIIAVVFTNPDRHVGMVIGDIRAGTENVAYTITITNCSADNATTTKANLII